LRLTPAARSEGGAGLVVLLLTVFLGLIGFGVVIPLLPFYGDVYKAPAWQIVLLFSGYSLGQFLGELGWGRLSDRIGRRPVLLIAMVCSALSFVGFAFAPNVWVGIVARFLSGIVTGTMSTAQGYIADVTPPGQRAARLSMLSAVAGVGFVVGPALGGVLAHPELGAIGMRIPVLVAGGMYVLAALGVLFFLPDSVRRKPAGAAAREPVQAPGSARGKAFADPLVMRLLLLTFVSFCAFSTVMPAIGFWSQATLGWGPREVGLFMAFAGGTGAGVQMLIGQYVTRRVGEMAVITVSLVMCLLFLGVLSFVDSAPIAVTCLVLAVAGHMASQPATATLISRLTPADRQGAVLGANMSVAALARVSGPVTAGILISAFTTSAPFLAASIILLPAVILAAGARRNRRF
jgi:MFS transporter, DHA1 family, tetracycline resistance protein